MKFYFYVDQEGVRQGPLPLEDITSNDISPDTLVWCKGMKEWQKAKTVEDFSTLLQSIVEPCCGKKNTSSNGEINCPSSGDINANLIKGLQSSDNTASLNIDEGIDNLSRHIDKNIGNEDISHHNEHDKSDISNQNLHTDNSENINDEQENNQNIKKWLYIMGIIIGVCLLFGYIAQEHAFKSNGDDIIIADTVTQDTVVGFSPTTYSFRTIKKEAFMKSSGKEQYEESYYCCKSILLKWPYVSGEDDLIEDIEEYLLHFVFDDKDKQYCANGNLESEIKHFLSTPSFTGEVAEYEYISSIPDSISYSNLSTESYELQNVMQSNIFISFSLRVEEYAGGAHPYEFTRYMNYNKYTNKQVSLNEVFRNPYDGSMISTIKNLLKKKYSDHDVSFGNNNMEDLSKLNWYISKKGIVVHFNTYEIGSYADGEFEVVIPYHGENYKKLYTDVFIKNITEE